MAQSFWILELFGTDLVILEDLAFWNSKVSLKPESGKSDTGVDIMFVDTQCASTIVAQEQLQMQLLKKTGYVASVEARTFLLKDVSVALNVEHQRMYQIS